MTNAIRVLVSSLGDFPLEPDSGKAWLWSGDGQALLWLSDQAASEVGLTSADNASSLADPSAFRGFLPLLAQAAPDREPIRVQQVSLSHAGRGSVYTCLCRHVPLASGGFGLLAVAIGAPARSMAAIREQESSRATVPAEQPTPLAVAAPPLMPLAPVIPASDPAPRLVNVPVATPTPAAPTPAAPARIAPVQPTLIEPEKHAAPEWTRHGSIPERPLRFVWQTDEAGRFVHLSRELSEAVGPANAMVIGQTWDQMVLRHGILEADGVSIGFRSKDTWTAVPALWPVAHSNLGVPVEMAGMRVLDGKRFMGFRGYGIARIERAIIRPGSAVESLSQDVEPVTERPEERFGPAVLRKLPEIDQPEGGSIRDLRRPDPAPLAVPASGPTAAHSELSHQAPAPVAQSPEFQAPVELPFVELPLAGLSPAGLPPVGLPEVQEKSIPASSLSPSERDAFREIAKSLATLAPPVPQPNSEGQRAALPEPRIEVPARDAPPLELPRKPRPLDLIVDKALEHEGATGEPGKNGDPSIVPHDVFEHKRIARLPTDPLREAAGEIMERLPVGLLVMQQGKAVFANRALLELGGYPDLDTFLKSGGAERLFSGRSGVGQESGRLFTVVNRSGDVVSVEASIHAISWNEQPATLTSLRKAQENPNFQQQKATDLDLLAAKAELRELHSVLETATDGVILLDAKGRIFNLNRSAEALFGFDQNEIIGENLTILLEPESHVTVLDYLESLKSHGVGSLLNDGRDVRGRERNGGVIPLFMTIGRIGDSQGTTKFCAVLRDITHWKKVESDLLDAKRAAEDSSAHKTDFLARISHEIRTPLNAIIGFSQVMMSESFGPVNNDRYRQYIKDINTSGEHVVSLVNDLLDLSKVASGKLELNFGSVDLNAAVAACVSMIQPQANAGKVIVRSQLASSLPPVVADERSVRQILLNLLSNAAKFTEAGGQVVASTSLTERGEVKIRVRDTGIGMSQEDVKRALEPFRQIPGPLSSGGTGLGLPLTKALVEANRAGFVITSDAGKGTLVEVTFPSTRVLAE